MYNLIFFKSVIYLFCLKYSLKTINNYLKKIVKHTLKYVMIIIKNTLDTLYIKGKTILGQ